MPSTKPRSAAGRGTNNGLAHRHRIAELQRARLISAMFDVVCARGASGVTVADVVTCAGVSRRTFYELFGDVEECLLASLEQALGCAHDYVIAAYEPSAPWPVRIRAALEAVLSFLDDEPLMGRLLIVESLCCGSKALARRSHVLAQIAGQIDAGRAHARDTATPSSLTAEGLVGASLSVLHTRLLARQRAPMLALCSPLMSMIVLPYLGPSAARRELVRPLVARKRCPSSPASLDRLSELPMRLTHRTICVLCALAAHPGASNKVIGDASGVADQGQISKLLQRLQRLGLVENHGAGTLKGLPNAWKLTVRGREIERAMDALGKGE